MDPVLLLTILIAPVLVSLLQAALAPLFAGLTADKVARSDSAARKQRALERVEANPLCVEGARLAALYIDGSGGFSEVLRACTIVEIRRGYIELVDDGGRRMCFTLSEFEAMHPLYAKADS